MAIFWEIWGTVAGLITTSGYIPQIIKGYKTKKLEDLSYFLNIFFGLGMLMWLVYGIAVDSLAIIIANVIGVTLNFIIILMKYYYHQNSLNYSISES